MDERKLTQDEINEATAYFNLAALLGRAIQAAAYNIQHPAGSSRIEYVTEEDEKEEPEEPGPHPDATIHSDEGDVKEQIDQVIAMYTPGVAEFLRESSLRLMFLIACEQFSFDDENLAADVLTPEDQQKVAMAWVIVKRVFSVRHPDEAALIISAAETAIRENMAITFRPMDDIDRQFVVEVCSRCRKILKGGMSISQALESFAHGFQEITEVQSSGKIVLLSAEIARKMIPLARQMGVGEVNVGSALHPVMVRASIGDQKGMQSVPLTRTDYDVMEAVGQLVQENGEKIIVTPSQIYQKIAFSDPNYRPSQQTIDEIVASMDKLLYTPATIDFTEQIEKHTKLKAKNKDIDNGNVDGSISGPIILGLHLQGFSASYKGRAVEHAFLIYGMPMFYYYAKTVKQLVTVDGYLLSGNTPRDRTAPKKAQKKEPAQQRLTLKEIGLRRYLLERINYFKRLRDNKKQHEFMFAFETIAKELDYEIDTPKRLRMLREQTYEFMQEQVAKKNIKACDYYYKGRALSGIKIIL